MLSIIVVPMFILNLLFLHYQEGSENSEKKSACVYCIKIAGNIVLQID